MSNPARAGSMKVLMSFIQQGSPLGFSSFFNAHFPGLYSIVLAADGECLTRAFIAKPGELHPDLQSYEGTFLWHSHAYDFTETTIAGSVTNSVIKVGSQRQFHEYEIEAGIATGRKPTIKWVGKRLFDLVPAEVYSEGESWSMTYKPIHRVIFKPSGTIGWFACMVQERNKREPPMSVYCEKELTEIPNASVLYQKINESEAISLVSDLVKAIEDRR